MPIGAIGAETVVTLAIVAVIVAVLALYLITIASLLTRVSFILDTVLLAVRAIVNQAQPLEGHLREIHNDVAGMEDALRGVLEGAGVLGGRRPGGLRTPF